LNIPSIAAFRKGKGYCLVAWICGCTGISNALEIRDYSASRHDRFVGYPSAPAFNDSAYYGSRKFTGVAWIPGEGNSRQFALVSPKHVVFARHFLPALGTTIRFLGSDGITVDRTIASVHEVLNGDSLPTDLCLLTLSAPLAEADGVKHFPYLNLTSDAAYANSALTVFGWDVKAGRGSLFAIEDFSVEGINTTRVMRFQYPKFLGNQDDARVVGFDSGSPTFGSDGVNPAILGIHTAAGSSLFHFEGYDSFIPHYIGQLDALMAPEGYRMTPAYPPDVSLVISQETPGSLKQAYPGSCRFDLTNSGANDAGNARMSLHFSSGSAPDAVTVSGWLAETEGPEDWVFRRANLPAGAISEFHFTWNSLPAVSLIQVEISRKADGSPSALETFQLPVIPTFKAWAAGLDDTGQSGDPDGDGVANLLEYALGGDPTSGRMDSSAGVSILPAITVENGLAVLSFPVRDDADSRGLTYTPEFSQALDQWSAVDVPAYTDASAPYTPAEPGFSRRTITWDSADPRRFCRIRITLSE
jgi:hypothetical protein